MRCSLTWIASNAARPYPFAPASEFVHAIRWRALGRMSMVSWSAPPWSRRWSAATTSGLFWDRCARDAVPRLGTLEDALKRVYRAASLLQVAHARNVLITAGIECELRNQYLAGALGDLPMMETWPQLYVDDDDEP